MEGKSPRAVEGWLKQTLRVLPDLYTNLLLVEARDARILGECRVLCRTEGSLPGARCGRRPQFFANPSVSATAGRCPRTKLQSEITLLLAMTFVQPLCSDGLIHCCASRWWSGAGIGDGNIEDKATGSHKECP